MRAVDIRTIPQREHRYATAGDYWRDRYGIDQIRVSFMPDWRMGFLVMIHEMIEYALCLDRKIEEKAVMDFDMAFEGEGEPGDDPDAPYYKEHQFAEAVERLVCNEFGIPWHEYDASIEGLFADA